MNTNTRQALLFVTLAGALAIRWLDPLPKSSSGEEPVSAPVVRESPESAPQAASGADRVAQFTWPLRSQDGKGKDADLFATRSQVIQQQEAAKRAKAPPPPPYVAPPPPPPPPPPVEPAPPLQVIGTWGAEPELSVFLSSAQGTTLVKPGDTVLSNYKVQSVNRQQLTLVNLSTHKEWPLAIPQAPSVLNTWPGR